jgi:hypothetical protein
MNYINKQVAKNTAFNMLKEQRDKVTEKENELAKICKEIAIKSFDPKEYKMVTSLSSGWIRTRRSFHFKSSYETICESVNSDVYCMENTYSIDVSKEDFEKIKSCRDSISEMKSKLEILHSQITETLLKLRTAIRIQKEFPEAFQYLPKDILTITSVAALPIKSIMENIEKFPD